MRQFLDASGLNTYHNLNNNLIYNRLDGSVNEVYHNTNSRFEVVDSSLENLKVSDDDLRYSIASLSVMFSDAIDELKSRLEDMDQGITLTASQMAVFVDGSTSVSLNATCKSSAASIEIFDSSGNVLASGSGYSLYASTNVTPTVEGDIKFTARASIGGTAYSDTVYITAVKPIYYGSGTVYTDVDQVADPKTSPTGTYSVTVGNDMDNIYFLIPISMSFSVMTMNGFNVPMNTKNVTFADSSYRVYESNNTYDAGTYTLAVNSTTKMATNLPIYYGSGQDYRDASTSEDGKTTPAGVYTIDVNNDGDYVFFVIPDTMTMGPVMMNGLIIPMSAESVDVDGNPYIAYKSMNSYDADKYVLVVN